MALLLGPWGFLLAANSTEERLLQTAKSDLYHINQEEKLSDTSLDIFREKRVLWDATIEPAYVRSWYEVEVSPDTKKKIAQQESSLKRLHSNWVHSTNEAAAR